VLMTILLICWVSAAIGICLALLIVAARPVPQLGEQLADRRGYALRPEPALLFKEAKIAGSASGCERPPTRICLPSVGRNCLLPGKNGADPEEQLAAIRALSAGAWARTVAPVGPPEAGG
jgi:hypothetical protein